MKKQVRGVTCKLLLLSNHKIFIELYIDTIDNEKSDESIFESLFNTIKMCKDEMLEHFNNLIKHLTNIEKRNP